jgi:hypothetical protein
MNAQDEPDDLLTGTPSRHSSPSMHEPAVLVGDVGLALVAQMPAIQGQEVMASGEPQTTSAEKLEQLTVLCNELHALALAFVDGEQNQAQVQQQVSAIEVHMKACMADRSTKFLQFSRRSAPTKLDLVFEALCITRFDGIFKNKVNKFAHATRAFQQESSPFFLCGALGSHSRRVSDAPAAPVTGGAMSPDTGAPDTPGAAGAAAEPKRSAKKVRRVRATGPNAFAEVEESYIARFRTRRYSFKHKLNKDRLSTGESDGGATSSPSASPRILSPASKPQHFVFPGHHVPLGSPFSSTEPATPAAVAAAAVIGSMKSSHATVTAARTLSMLDATLESPSALLLRAETGPFGALQTLGSGAGTTGAGAVGAETVDVLLSMDRLLGNPPPKRQRLLPFGTPVSN